MINKKFAAIFMLCFSQLVAQGPAPAKMTSSQQSSTTIQGLEPLGSTKDTTKKGQITSNKTLPNRVSPPQLVKGEAEYLHPGILVNIGGRWEGSDHLLNISSNIGVFVSLIKPEEETLDVSEAQLQKEVENIFVLTNIKPETLVVQGKPPLPAFEIEIFVYPIERGYTACCSGRLFESVTLERFKMDPNMAFQAITWEKQHLIVSPKDQFSEQLSKTVQEIAKAFSERYQVYERIKKTL